MNAKKKKKENHKTKQDFMMEYVMYSVFISKMMALNQLGVH